VTSFHPRSAQSTHMDILLSQGKTLARQGARASARSHFARVLAIQPDHVEALLWLAGLAKDPWQSVRYLDRVLQIAPDNEQARLGMSWARKRLQLQAQRVAQPEAGGATRKPSLYDVLLLGSIVAAFIVSCAILGFVVWQAPRMVGAAQQPRATPTSVPTLTLTPTNTPEPTSTLTATPILEPTSTPTPSATATPSLNGSLTTPRGEKWIELDLSEQRLTAHEGEVAVLTTLVSTGVARLPTPVGEFKILSKVRSQVMAGPGYYLPNVQFVSYFYRSYAIHGTYWHNNFGHPMSHGCVNLTNADAEWIYSWAPIGTPVRIHL
jgi:lipoprotein-anchoring transpeptidase ErfK/SrfK